MTAKLRDTTSAAIDEYMRSARPVAVDWLRDLVATDSESPGEIAAQVRVAEIARSVGLRADLVDADPDGDLAAHSWHVETGLGYTERPNCIVTVPEVSAAPLVCNAHIDTVALGGGWTRSPRGDLVGERFYGLGSADTKASTVAALLAASCLQRLGVEPVMPIELHSVIDEEPGGNGSLAMVRRMLAEDLPRPGLVVVMEPSKLDVLTGHRGMLWHRIACHGVQAHGSSGAGHNAIEIASEVTLRIRELNRDFRSWAGSGYAPPLVNVGIIAGGHEVYTTPGLAVLDVSTRYAPGQRERVARALRSAVAGIRLPGGCRVESELVSDYDAAETDAAAPALEGFVEEVRRRYPAAGLDTLTGTCDMRHYVRELGVPTVIFGPGDLAVAHAADEYVDIEEIFVAAGVLASVSARGLDRTTRGGN